MTSGSLEFDVSCAQWNMTSRDTLDLLTTLNGTVLCDTFKPIDVMFL